jgi:hypothetical protein
MTKRIYYNYSLLFVLTVCIVLSLFYCPPFDHLEDDKDIWQYGGWAISKGIVLYRDLFDHKPPLIFLLNFMGLPLGNWGLWVIDLCLALLTTWLFFRLCVDYRLPHPWLLPLFFNLMIRDFLMCAGMGMTREYTALFQLIFFCVLMGKSRYRYFLTGLLTALIFFMQQEQALFLAPFLVYMLLTGDTISILTRCVCIGAGFLTILLPIILYFAWNHALNYLWEDAFRFNFAWYTAEKKSFPDHLRTVKKELDEGNYELPFLVAITLGFSSLALAAKKKTLLIAALAGVALSLTPEFMGARPAEDNFSDYLMPLSTSLSILLFIVFAFSEENIFQNKAAQLIYGALICCSLSYTALQHGTHLINNNGNPEFQAAPLNYLRQHRPGDYQLYIFSNDNFIFVYNEFRILAPSRWIYHHFWKWYDRWDADQAILKSIGADLLRHRTRYVWMDVAEFAGFRNSANYAWWTSFLQDHYRPVPLSGWQRSALWEIKDGK